MSRAARRHEILNAAEAHLSQDPERETTMAEIAALAGVSHMTLYRHFSNKKDLLHTLVKERGMVLSAATREDTLARILQAARRTFARHGFDAATVESIAEEAGIGTATVYRHFASKEKLIQAFLRSLSVGHFFCIEEIQISDNPQQDLKLFAERVLHAMEQHKDLLHLWLISKLQSRSEAETTELQQHILPFQHRLKHYFQTLSADKIPQSFQAQEATQHFTGLLLCYGWLLPMLSGQSIHAVEHTSGFLASLFLQDLPLPEPASEQGGGRGRLRKKA